VPFYTYQCPACQAQVTLMRTVARRNDLVACSACQGTAGMERQWEVPQDYRGGLPGREHGIRWADGSGLSTKPLRTKP